MAGRPGQEFYAQKVQRAREVPSAQRCPAVAAFVAAEELNAEIRKLLPARGSERALAATAANQRQVARAYALVALVHYLCPSPPVGLPDSIAWYLEFLPQLYAVLHYQSSSDGSGGTGSPRAGVSDFDVAAAALDSFIKVPAFRRMGGEHIMMAVAEGMHLLTLLRQPELRAAIDRQLALFEPPQLTAHQLQCATAHEAGMAAVHLLSAALAADRSRRQQVQLPPALQRSQAANLRLSSEETATMLAAAEDATAVLLQLEPGRPKTYMLAAAAEGLHHRTQQACELYMRGLELARQQRSDFFVALFGMQLAGQAIKPGVSRAAAEAAAAAFAEVQPALRRCKRMLPLDWTAELEVILPMATVAHTTTQQRLQLGATAPPLGRESMQRAMAAAGTTGLCFCSFCGQDAVGLRLCSQCRQARYCSTECQRQAWRAGHKQECRPAGRG